MDTSPSYAIGEPALRDLWIDPASGDETAAGNERSRALRTIAAAWRKIPERCTGHGWRILLCPGRYTPDADGHINLTGRHGTRECPILLQSADAASPVQLPPLDVEHCSYVYVLDLKFVSSKIEHIPASTDNVVHFADCDHILLRRVVASGDPAPPGLPRLAFKANQCSHLYVEDCEFSDSYAYVFAYVAVHYGHVVRSKFHRCRMAGICLKGGSAYHLVAGNEVSDANVMGIGIGEGAGFAFMVPPWIQYEAYGMKVVNNVVRDCGGGLAVSGGYDVLMAYNTCYRVGSSRDTVVVALGGHSWVKDPANAARCERYHAQGGWCLPDGEEFIPNRNVQICNNLIFNPDGYESQHAHFGISGPMSAKPNSNVPDPIGSTNLRIAGNVVWNGGYNKPVLDDVENMYGLAARPTYSLEELRRENQLNTLRPELINPGGGNFRPAPNGDLAGTAAVPLFDFPGDEKAPPVPAVEADNSVPSDRDGKPRNRGTIGAYSL